MSELVKELTDGNFDEVLDDSAPLALLDFTASWCGPCKQLAPLIEELAQLYAGRAIVAKIDIDANPALMDRFGIHSVPTLVLYKGRKTIARLDQRTRTRLTAALDTHLV